MLRPITSEKNLKGKRVLLRLDLNAPIANGKVVDLFRIEKALPVVLFLKKSGAKVIIVSHIGRKKEETLEPVRKIINKHVPVKFISDFESPSGVEILREMEPGDVAMLENLRAWDGEKEKSVSFAKKLSSLADIYVNDAFAVSHRHDASIFLIPKYLPSFIGPLFAEEIKNLSFAFHKHKPFLFILGGAKFETKLPLLKKFWKIADKIFVGGALANNFFKAKNFEIGRSLVDDEHLSLNAFFKGSKLLLPLDLSVEGKDAKTYTRKPTEVNAGENIMDCGPLSVKLLKEECKKAKFILWNGPLGNYEAGYGKTTKELAKIVLQTPVRSVVGGGDTVAAIGKAGRKIQKNVFVSTGGGAMLDYLAHGTLPGIEAIKKSKI